MEDRNSKTAAVMYKCRNCGVKFKDGTRASFLTMQLNMYTLISTGQPRETGIGTAPKLLTYHDCNDNEYGLADFVAVVIHKD